MKRPLKVDDPNDLSALLLRQENVEPFVGPVEISSSSTLHRRGLVATHDVVAGECLLVTPPVLTVQHVESSPVEQNAEKMLVMKMRESIRNRDWPTVRAFLSLVGSKSGEQDLTPTIHTLLATGRDMSKPSNVEGITHDDLIQIVRRNAFGPDFVTYETIEKRRQANAAYNPTRILGLYPVSAMINHSCCVNAVRVFCNDFMVVHACANIAKGTEVVWSYLPPTLPYPRRQSVLKDHHNFVCNCIRCKAEGSVWRDPTDTFTKLLQVCENPEDDIESGDLSRLIHALEAVLSSTVEISNEAKRYVRVGFAQQYIRYLNHALSSEEKPEDLLSLCTQLHFSFCTCDNASTEHLSVVCIQKRSTNQKHYRN